MEHMEKAAGATSKSPRDVAAQTINYYRVLDVDQRATRMIIREAYLRLKATYNAGSAALYSLISEDEAKEQMAIVEEAFRVLNDDVARQELDQRLGIGKGVGNAQTAPAVQRPKTSALGEFTQDQSPTWPDVTESAGTVHTARSALPIIKLKASRAGSDEMVTKMLQLIEASDAGDGDLFKRLRQLCEVTEDEMQERTKISIGYIHGIEANRFERLPQAVYVKGFLRSYFRYLCVPDAEKMVAAFSARLQDWQANKKS